MPHSPTKNQLQPDVLTKITYLEHSPDRLIKTLNPTQEWCTNRRSHIVHKMHGAHVSSQGVFGGEHAVTDGARGQLAVQLHVVVEALSPSEHLAADAARQAAHRRRACEPRRPHGSVDCHRLASSKHHPENGHGCERMDRYW